MERVGGLLVIHTLDPEADALTRLQEKPAGLDLNVELVYLAGHHRFTFRVHMEWLPGLRPVRVDSSLRSPQPPPRQQGLVSFSIDVQKAGKPENLCGRRGTIQVQDDGADNLGTLHHGRRKKGRAPTVEMGVLKRRMSLVRPEFVLT